MLPYLLVVGWIFFGLYGVGMKAADQCSATLAVPTDKRYYSIVAYLLMFVGGPVSVGFWNERNSATLLSELKRSD
jgi:hypothetical protein